MELIGKIVLVIGGGIRVGWVLVMVLVEVGCNVFIYYGNFQIGVLEVQ